MAEKNCLLCLPPKEQLNDCKDMKTGNVMNESRTRETNYDHYKEIYI